MKRFSLSELERFDGDFCLSSNGDLSFLSVTGLDLGTLCLSIGLFNIGLLCLTANGLGGSFFCGGGCRL